MWHRVRCRINQTGHESSRCALMSVVAKLRFKLLFRTINFVELVSGMKRVRLQCRDPTAIMRHQHVNWRRTTGLGFLDSLKRSEGVIGVSVSVSNSRGPPVTRLVSDARLGFPISSPQRARNMISAPMSSIIPLAGTIGLPVAEIPSLLTPLPSAFVVAPRA
jgi:hypothetical protein